ncbi:3-oxo-5-alpha-steroid 4-dehydrogenase [Moniliophthora roreri MCA 2997]|uniref:3-oxo-5-alpha-steroid 4-dehydrogenase n=1 Tax=Moniliophthora roreri (strain MCA 2997) TaxID=1381753 RepID=V2WMJ2_MONRO|nr:3-oxo-5-alpha-steroid 4-dehydrogenase [Moniliophthora roreri MCA 2997]
MPSFLPLARAQFHYDCFRKWFFLGAAIVSPLSFVFDAPFGRFASTSGSIFLIDGIKAWIVMEIISPIFFTYTYFSSPLSTGTPEHTIAQNILAGMFLVHYTNRSLISPLRTPSRSKSHFYVLLSAILFNVINGSLLGSYLSSPGARAYLGNDANTWSSPVWYIGLVLWAVGFIGNVVHDEILLNIRRKFKKSGKKDGQGEHYAIPNGLLYDYVSFPNYSCEWLEWLGFALAASPVPLISLDSLFKVGLLDLVTSPSSQLVPSLTPPWIFLFNEVVLMFPRAYKGHLWYKNKFGEAYPSERKIVIPFIL